MMIRPDEEFALGVPVGWICKDFINKVVEVPFFKNVINELCIGVRYDDDGAPHLLH